MKVNLQVAMFVTLGLIGLTAEAKAQAPGQVPTGYAYYKYDHQDDQQAADEAAGEAAPMAQSSGPCGCDSPGCNGGCGGLMGGTSLSGRMGGGILERGGQAFAGADWLSLRADLSDATDFVERDLANAVDTFHQADFDYNTSYRLYGGYRFSDCCEELLLSYARYRSEATATSPAASATRQFLAPCEVQAITPGSTVTSEWDIDADIYDVDLGRTLPLGSALGDCSCNWFPAWDIKWFFGARYADVELVHDVSTTDAAANNLSCRMRVDFEGLGPRIGVDGRRYIGRNGTFSVFGKGAISLLLGDVDYLTTAISSTPGVTPTQRANFQRVIPVTEIEVGASVHLSDNVMLSGGYMLSAWHDLGMGEQYFATTLPATYDDANILGFDAFFARGEIAY